MTSEVIKKLSEAALDVRKKAVLPVLRLCGGRGAAAKAVKYTRA